MDRTMADGKPPLKHRIACGLIELTRFLSFKQAWSFAGLGMRLFYARQSCLRDTICANVKLAFPDLGEQEQATLARNSFRHTLAFGLETGSVWLKPLEYGVSHIRHIHGLELLEAAQASGSGVLIVLPHLGNWEMANQFIAPRAKVVALYKPHPNARLEQHIYQARTRAGVTMLPTNRQGVAGILRHLKQGGVTVVLPDQVPDANGGIMAEFFGQPAATTTLVPKLARSSKAQILGLVCARDESGGFSIHISKAPSTLADEDTQRATQAMNCYIEGLVRLFPSQYQWSYKRFKHAHCIKDC